MTPTNTVILTHPMGEGKTAFESNGYGRPDTLDNAKLNLQMIDKANASVGLEALTPGRPSFLVKDGSEGD